jgi:acetyl-CoA carboxylase biotin carboxyl carrier protein
VPVVDFSFEEVGEILRALEKLDGASVYLEYGDLKLEVRRGAESVPPSRTVTEPVPAPQQETRPQQELRQSDAEDVPAHWVAVTTPMVGTFYRAPGPAEPSFVEPGDAVRPGQTVGVLEVMKLFTELKSEVDGKVARIDAENAALVESGQALIWIEPA